MDKSNKDILKHAGLRATSVRLAILDKFIDKNETALAHNQLESALNEVDRVTIYRTLKTFEEKGIIHQVVDGSTIQKYALCHQDCSEHHHEDTHAHFSCNVCGETVCLDDVHTITPKKIPSGFKVENTHIVLKGSCDKCSK